ncbi:MAG: Peptidoglycan-binding domain 1 protein [Acidimicrobiaceae bacterium]|nr:Peptidoglycan-binding domain 1 protein [Acidimicrobiaceae bacterium]
MSTLSPQPRARYRSLRRFAIALAALLVAGGVAVALGDPFSGSRPASSASSDNAYPTSSATVTERALSSQSQVSATLGYAESYSVSLPTGTPTTVIRQDQATLLAAEGKVASDERTLSRDKTVAAPTLASTLLAAQTQVKADQLALSEARAQLASDRRLGCPLSSSATTASPASSGSAPSAGGTGAAPASGAGQGASSPSTGAGSGSTGSGSSGGLSAGLRPHDSSGGSPSTTTTTVPASAPLATTGPVDQTTRATTTLTGTVEPNGAGTNYSFEYGTSANYGQSTATTSAGAGTSPVGVAVAVAGLSPGQSYHYRLVATSALGTSYGQDQTFQTSAEPFASTGSASAVTATSESFSGTVDPGGLDTTYFFEWGRTASLGRRTRTQDAGAASDAGPVTAVITGLKAATTYDFALVAKNALGTSVGPTQTFQSGQSSCVAEVAAVNDDARQLRSATDALALDRLTGGSGVAQDQHGLATDQASAQAAQQALSLDEIQASNPGTTFTSLPAAGQSIHRGEAVYRLDGRSVPLFYGTVTPYRALYLGVSGGPDVGQLNANLTALGFAGAGTGQHFSSATEQAVAAWQASIGVRATGIVSLGDFVVAPGPFLVSGVTASAGQAAAPGMAVLTATSTAPVVTIALDASQESEVKVGDPVTVTLPDNSTTPGVVSSVGKIATAPASSSGSSGSSGSSNPTITVQVSLSDPKATNGLVEAPVEVAITTATVSNALVVPVDALLALASHGYALEEISPEGSHHLVAVSLGLFDDADGLVQVSGAGMASGQRVVVPGT